MEINQFVPRVHTHTKSNRSGGGFKFRNRRNKLQQKSTVMPTELVMTAKEKLKAIKQVFELNKTDQEMKQSGFIFKTHSF
jgi:hypothetical protein